MIITKEALERKINKMNEWLKLHPNDKLKEQKRNYYIGKICEMDDLNLNTIKI